ncbi:MAG: MlaD family protein [Solirubrobacteraceae bacterium]|jgi:phospholipid/cholesterol/gamma-HCH transport system substrate-binding protein|nr:MlaD family protein [Solirubrobacteraceae bacterium]MDP4672149.1 MlaD family protein [Solirubrobacteraceae bacterium]MDP4921453.1 MlaD family protein [Solirubrobacteraceae bacterium]MDP5034374.1 MlaD family protein [Solirubrobacteraceae bacterium]
MRREIIKHARDFIAIGVVALLAVLIGGYILSNQRFYLPAWVPIIGSDFVDYYAQFSTAQAVTPGQGQTVIVAGVTVGEIGGVTLKNGTAMVDMKIREKYANIYKDATALLRPKTGLNDMVIELNPGSASSGEIARGGTLPISRTLPNVNPDQILAGLDADTRAYLQLLVNGGGEGLNGNSTELSATLKRFDPITVYLAQIGKEMGRRQAYIKQGIHNFRLLTEELGARDTQLARWVRSSNDVFTVFADQQSNLRETLSLLPGALDATNNAVIDSNALTNQMGPALQKLQPTAVGTAASLESLQSFAKATTPVLEDQLRPFTAEAGPTVAALKPAAADLAATAPQLDTTFSVLNTLTNELAYNPPGAQEGYLYWLAWGNHLSANMLSAQDSGGPIRRGTLFSSCDALTIYEDLGKGNPELGTLIELLNAPKVAEVCATPAAAAQVASGKQLARRALKQQRENTPGAPVGPVSDPAEQAQPQQSPAAASEAQDGDRR